MPLEINEIDIAMRVESGDGGWGSGLDRAPSSTAEIDREDLIEECVRRVLQVLRAQGEP